MLRESEFFKNRKMRILLCIELLLLVIGIAGLFGKSGVVVGTDETEAVLTEGVSLQAGVYIARLYYDIHQTSNSSFGVVTDDVRHGVLRSNQVPLYEGIGVRECRFYLLNSVDRLRVELEDNDGGAISIQGVEIVTGTEGSRIFLFWVVLLSLLINGVAVFYLYHRKHPVSLMPQVVYFGVPILGLMASLPVMVDYTLSGADLVFHLMRIEALSQHISNGEFFSKIESVWLAGHGYANSVFYADTFLVIPALLQLLGFSINSAYRLYIVIVNLATAWIGYVSFSKCFQSREVGMLGCALYTLAPYRLYNIYNRAAVGEYTAMIFLPLLAWGFYRIYTEDVKQKGYLWNWVVPTIGFTGMIQSHVLSCEMVGLCVILLCLILWKKTFAPKTFVVLATTVLMTVLVNGWFLVPFLDLMASDQYYFGNNANVLIQNRGVLLAQLFYTLQSAGSSSRFAETGMVDTEPIGIGAAMLLSVLLWIGLLVRSRRVALTQEQKVQRNAANVALLIGGMVLAMSTCYFPWDFLSSLNKVFATLIGSLQFPTRLTSIATLCMVFVACVACLWIFREKVGIFSGRQLVVVIALVALVFGTYQVNDILMSREGLIRLYSPQGMGHSAVLGAEYLPLDANLGHMTYHAPVMGEGVAIDEYEKDGLQVNAFVTNNGAESYLELPMLYYKGYHAKVAETGESLPVMKGNNADVRVILPEGFSGTIQVQYTGMWYWHLAEVVTGVTLVGVLGFFVWKRRTVEK